MEYTYKYPKADITADIVVLALDAGKADSIKVLVIKRKNEPFKGCYALPGGFLEVVKETLAECASKELKEETSLEIGKEDLHFLSMYDNPDRDPRGRVITAAYWVTVDASEMPNAKAGDDAAELSWEDPRKICNLMAFDHREILEDAVYMLTVQMLGR